MLLEVTDIHVWNEAFFHHAPNLGNRVLSL